MDDKEITKILIDMTATLASIETKLQDMCKDLDAHSKASLATKDDVHGLQRDVNRAKGAIAVILAAGAITAALRLIIP